GDYTAVPHHGGRRCIGFVIKRDVPLRFGQPCPERAAHLYGFQWPATGAAPAEIKEELTQRNPEGLFNQAAVLQITCQLKGLGSQRAPHAEFTVKVCATRENDRNGGQCQNIVYDGGPAEEARDGRQWRLGPYHAALALQALKQGCFLAANVCTSALADFQGK